MPGIARRAQYARCHQRHRHQRQHCCRRRGYLREAVESINNGANTNGDVVAVGAYGTNDEVRFNIAGAGVKQILLESELKLTRTVFTNGFSQIGAAANTSALRVFVVSSLTASGP